MWAKKAHMFLGLQSSITLERSARSSTTCWEDRDRKCMLLSSLWQAAEEMNRVFQYARLLS